jgi:hypothetical protein
MNEKTAIKKTRKPNAQSKAAIIRKLFARGKLTPKQIGEKANAPMPYVYVVRSKMKAEAGGLPAVSTKSPIPVFGGIQDIRDQPQIAVNPTTLAMQAPVPTYRYRSPALAPALALAPAHVVIEKPTFIERVKNTVRAWLS